MVSQESLNQKRQELIDLSEKLCAAKSFEGVKISERICQLALEIKEEEAQLSLPPAQSTFVD
jgi:hypothetical protein